MHDRRLREDVDFDKEEVPVTTLKKMKKGINPVEFEEELATSKAFHEQKESVLVPENQD